MLEAAVLGHDRSSGERLFDRCVANGAVVSDYPPIVANVLPVMASEAALCIEMPKIVDVTRPIGLHLRKEIGLIYFKYLYCCGLNNLPF